MVEVEELGQEVGLGGEAVGGQDGGVERGVGVLEGIRAGQLQRAIDRAQAADDFGRGADAANIAAGGRINRAWSTLESSSSPLKNTPFPETASHLNDETKGPTSPPPVCAICSGGHCYAV